MREGEAQRVDARFLPGRKRIPQLDGLRGVAILLVVFAHAWNGVYPKNRRLLGHALKGVASGGGLFGVQLFFVLSGFLITSMLLAERARTGGIALRAFYGRRARRLLPALFVIAGTYLIYVILTTAGAERRAGFGSVLRAVTYIEDLGPIIKRIPTSQFLGHTWSLAVEEQFYLLWPVGLLLVGRAGHRRVSQLAAAIILCTVVGRHLLSAAGIEAADLRHWDALMVGCLLAVRPMAPPRWLGRTAFGVLAASLLWWPQGLTWAYTLSAAVGAVALMHALTVEWLSHRLLRYFGRVSYGLYLWHAFLLRFGWPVVPTVILSVAIADVSFRFVESPFLRHRREGHLSGGGIEGPVPATG